MHSFSLAICLEVKICGRKCFCAHQFSQMLPEYWYKSFVPIIYNLFRKTKFAYNVFKRNFSNLNCQQFIDIHSIRYELNVLDQSFSYGQYGVISFLYLWQFSHKVHAITGKVIGRDW